MLKQNARLRRLSNSGLKKRYQAKAAADAEAKRKAAEAEQQRLAVVKAEEERKAKSEADTAAKYAPLPQSEKYAAPFTVLSPLTVKLQDTFLATDTSTRDSLNDVTRALTTLSDGKLKIELLAAGSIAPAFQVLDAVHTGALDAAWTMPAYWYGVSRAFALTSGIVPMGLDAASFVRWIEAEGAAESNRLIVEVAKKNVRSIPCGLQRPGGEWFKKPVRQIDDFRGLKFRTVGLPIEVAKELGAAVIVLPGGEIVPAMEKGLIDASDWTTPASAIQLGLANLAKNLQYPGLTRPVHLLELLIGDNAWRKLGSSGQAGVQAVCRQNLHRNLDAIPALERQGLDEARRRGVTVQPYPPAMLNAARQASQRVLENFARQDPDFAKVLASYNKYR
jgi:TRAP-type mannitol/chloroaromatic compound transport system substrate-binding protein